MSAIRGSLAAKVEATLAVLRSTNDTAAAAAAGSGTWVALSVSSLTGLTCGSALILVVCSFTGFNMFIPASYHINTAAAAGASSGRVTAVEMAWAAEHLVQGCLMEGLGQVQAQARGLVQVSLWVHIYICTYTNSV